METNAYFILVYGVIVIIGGLMGYSMAGSLPSLIMGSSFGLLLLFCGWAMLRNSTFAFYSASALAAVLALFFLYRFIETGKVMPAGVMALLSLFILGFSLFSKR